MKKEWKGYRLSSGRLLCAEGDVLGIIEGGSMLHGDGFMCCMDVDGHSIDAEAVLTFEERAEVAGEMVARWKKWGGIP